MTRRQWRFHATRFALGTAVVLLVGGFSGYWWPAIGIALAAYTAWLLYNTWRLHRWLRDGDSEPPESLGVWSDLFEQISRLQRRYREQQARNQAIIKEFQSMTDAFPDATLVLDEQDGITWFNSAAERMLGLRFPEDSGQPLTNLLRDPEFANWMAVDGKVESRFEMASPLDPNVHLSVHSVRHREDQRLLILRDVTDLHNLEQVRRDFVANVSHELRTPLTVLLGYLESLGDQFDDELGPAVSRMQEQARQMQALLNDLLELSRLQSDNLGGEQTSVDVCAILMQLKEQALEISQGNHDIDVDCQGGLYLTGSEADLESAFRNLINNAIHYTPEGGRITVRWKENADGQLAFNVSDTGIGIPRRDIPRLTERFYRVGSDRSRHTGGTGLGLSIVKHVLNAHDARLVIESVLGEGSTFTCLFPAKRRSLRQERKEQA
ncbi:phosphate regulon sensor histidine kinase PhoR [Marinihelvus fidelis]|uniref:Phosphate regulon sensor protein PhoR n=1 Tax=Marinihelvus fidelis TaxID=2613842 RepID=A0A5N0T5W5_9GAMM|nr:phosphate regulon sensor histidine kinase PhoR [Marinihelvus fidelis]KAA9129844.1 phosphate regulon sensor histidine kinase PhoR [Marinihelvus fidelis]